MISKRNPPGGKECEKAMKTLAEFIKEIEASGELREELKAASGETLNEFLKKHGCDADAKEFTAFLRACHEGEIEDDDAAAAAGGTPPQSVHQLGPMDPHMPV